MRLTRLMIVAYVSGHAGMVGFVAPLTTVLADCNDPYTASGSGNASGSCDERLPLDLLRESAPRTLGLSFGCSEPAIENYQ